MLDLSRPHLASAPGRFWAQNLGRDCVRDGALKREPRPWAETVGRVSSQKQCGVEGVRMQCAMTCAEAGTGQLGVGPPHQNREVRGLMEWMGEPQPLCHIPLNEV